MQHQKTSANDPRTNEAGEEPVSNPNPRANENLEKGTGASSTNGGEENKINSEITDGEDA